MRNVWLDGMMGLVTGDALGVPVQFMEREEIRLRAEGPVTGMESGGVYDLPAGTWSDDSSMALASLDSIRTHGDVLPEDIMKKFVKWYDNGEYTPFGEPFDQGNTCSGAVDHYKRYGDPDRCGRTGEYANGNGALMRILPVCLFYIKRAERICTSDDLAVAGIHRVTALTHNHLRSKMACGLFYFMAKALVKGGGSLIDLLQKGLDEGFLYYGSDLRNLTEMARFGRLFHLDEFARTPEEEIRSSGYVLDTIEAAVWCLITTDSYRECELKAVNLGDDTDTVAAVAGGLAGLYYGYDSIPAEWLGSLQRREWLELLINRDLYKD